MVLYDIQQATTGSPRGIDFISLSSVVHHPVLKVGQPQVQDSLGVSGFQSVMTRKFGRDSCILVTHITFEVDRISPSLLFPWYCRFAKDSLQN
jgi:hypothetical protein